MNSQQEMMEPDSQEEPQVEYGKDREPGIAGPKADYILRSVDRWRLRGDGVLR